MRPIGYLKGNPLIIKPTLDILKKCQDLPPPKNRKEFIKLLRSELPKLLQGISKAKPDNLIYAQAIPTCEKLHLITKSINNRRLTLYGEKLLEENDDSKFKLKLCKALLDFDERECKIIKVLKETQKSPGEFVNFEEIVLGLNRYGLDAYQKMEGTKANNLKSAGINANQGTRLTDNLKFYDFAGLVLWKSEKVALNEARLKGVINDSLNIKSDVKEGEFFQVLYEEYKNLAKGGSPYVPVATKFRSSVCRRLDIDEELFNSKLLNLPTIYKGRHILLSPPMKGMAEGEIILKNKIPIYFISIYEKRK